MIRYTALVLIHFVVLSSFTLARNGKPGKLSVFNVTSTSCDSVRISWEPPTKGKKDITGYRIHITKIQDPMIINGKSYHPRISFITSLTEINVTNLTQEIVYRFSISAINYSDGTGNASIMNITVIPIEKITQNLLMSNKMVTSIVIGGTAVVFGVPLVISGLGFTATGVAASSIAGWLMPYLGLIGAGSWFANLLAVLEYIVWLLLSLFGGYRSTGGSSIIGLTYMFSENCVLEVDRDI